MKLTVEQIRDIARGAVRVEERDGKVSLCRFTKEQEELYKVRSEDFYKKSFATAGVALEFVTDSSTLSMEVEIAPGSSRTYFRHSIYVNNVKYGALECKKANRGVFGGKWTLPEGEKTVKIYFPWSVSSKILDLSLDNDASLTPVKRTKKMILIGDSITHGYDAAEPENSYACRLADALEAEGINKGIGAEIFFPALALTKDPIDPDYITVAYGTNDWSKGNKDAFDANCKAFYENLSRTYPKAKIFAITPIWRKNYAAGEAKPLMGTLDYIGEYIEKVTAELPNVTVIQGIDLVPPDTKCFSPDVLHPNDLGFKHYFENLLAEIQKHI